MDDEELLLGCQRGDPVAWASLRKRLSRLAPALFAAGGGLSVDDLDDIVQETLTTLLADDCRVLRAFRGESSLMTYLAAITRRVGWRWLTCHPIEIPLSQVDTPAIEGDPGQEIWLVAEQTLASADLLLLRLAARGYTAEEIAELLARIEGHPLTAEAVRQRRHRAIRRLRHALREEGKPETEAIGLKEQSPSG